MRSSVAHGRLARVVIPEVAHHVTQRGNRRQPVFFSDDDRNGYLKLVADACAAQGTRCLAWCLIDNHVRLILVSGRLGVCLSRGRNPRIRFSAAEERQ